MASETWSVRRLLEWTEEFLRKKGIESPRLEAQILLAHTLGCKKIDLYVRHEEEPAEDRRTAFREMIKKRSEGMPTAYLVGYREFYSLTFSVSPDVLIPRPDTETLVMEALRLLKPLASPSVLDIGTGSGCIAITVAKQHKSALVAAIDQSPTALSIARKNVEQHAVGDRVTLFEGDLFAPIAGRTFDMILSNPPYIAHGEFSALDVGVRDFEPRTALDGGPDGLDYYRRIAASAGQFLNPGGIVLVEIGSTQEAAVSELFANGFEVGKVIRDLSGQPRVLAAKARANS